jgi:hypothetical protein
MTNFKCSNHNSTQKIIGLENIFSYNTVPQFLTDGSRGRNIFEHAVATQIF